MNTSLRSVQAVRRKELPIKAQKPVPKSLFFIRKQARALLVISAYNFVSYDKNW